MKRWWKRNATKRWIELFFFLFIVEHSGTRSSEEVERHSSHSLLTATPRPRIRNSPNVFRKFVIFPFDRGKKEAGKQHLYLGEYQSINFTPFRFCSTFKRTFGIADGACFTSFHSPRDSFSNIYQISNIYVLFYFTSYSSSEIWFGCLKINHELCRETICHASIFK